MNTLRLPNPVNRVQNLLSAYWITDIQNHTGYNGHAATYQKRSVHEY